MSRRAAPCPALASPARPSPARTCGAPGRGVAGRGLAAAAGGGGERVRHGHGSAGGRPERGSRKHPSAGDGNTRASAWEPGRGEMVAPRCSSLSLPSRQRSQSTFSSAGARAACRLTAGREWRKGEGGAPPGSDGCQGNRVTEGRSGRGWGPWSRARVPRRLGRLKGRSLSPRAGGDRGPSAPSWPGAPRKWPSGWRSSASPSTRCGAAGPGGKRRPRRRLERWRWAQCACESGRGAAVAEGDPFPSASLPRNASGPTASAAAASSTPTAPTCPPWASRTSATCRCKRAARFYFLLLRFAGHKQELSLPHFMNVFSFQTSIFSLTLIVEAEFRGYSLAFQSFLKNEKNKFT